MQKLAELHKVYTFTNIVNTHDGGTHVQRGVYGHSRGNISLLVRGREMFPSHISRTSTFEQKPKRTQWQA